MRTEEQIHDLIEHYKELLRDHHLLLAEPIVRNTIEAVYESIIITLEWVLNEPQSLATTAREKENV